MPPVYSQKHVNITLSFDKVKTQYMQNALYLQILKASYCVFTLWADMIAVLMSSIPPSLCQLLRVVYTFK